LSRGFGQNFSLPRQRIAATKSYPLHFVLFTVEKRSSCGKLSSKNFYRLPRLKFSTIPPYKKVSTLLYIAVV
jgi:hypothetical protein